MEIDPELFIIVAATNSLSTTTFRGFDHHRIDDILLLERFQSLSPVANTSFGIEVF